MNFDGMVFPAPTPSYTYEEYKDQLFFIPKARIVYNCSDFSNLYPAPNGIAHIPCHYCPYPKGSSKILVYFHGNAEDLGRVKALMILLSEELKVHTIAMEYPGYGIYPGKPNADRISEESLNVYDYITNVIGWKPQNIIIFGRSIGSGFATFVAAKRTPGMLLLMSAFTSLKAVVKHIACFISFLVTDRLKNIELIQQVKCPKVFIHGLEDTLVPYNNSQMLYNESSEPRKLCLFPDMNHNLFDVCENLTEPVLNYWKMLGYSTVPEIGHSMPTIHKKDMPVEYMKDMGTHCLCTLYP